MASAVASSFLVGDSKGAAGADCCPDPAAGAAYAGMAP